MAKRAQRRAVTRRVDAGKVVEPPRGQLVSVEERARATRLSLLALGTIVFAAVIAWIVILGTHASVVVGAVVAGALLCADAAGLAIVWYIARR